MTEVYKSKYLKYKNKYYELKNKIDNLTGGDIKDDYINELKTLYPSCQHDNGLIKDADKYAKMNQRTTYGEMEYEGIESFSKLFNNDEIKYFIDFGSGNGKLPLYIATLPNIIKSYGIELVTERHNKAVELHATLSKYSQFTNKVELINDNMFTVLENKVFEHPALIWISNLCFDINITTELFSKLSEKMKSGSIIGCSKKPLLLPTRIVELILDGKTYNTLPIEMSWNKSSTIYIYKIT